MEVAIAARQELAAYLRDLGVTNIDLRLVSGEQILVRLDLDEVSAQDVDEQAVAELLCRHAVASVGVQATYCDHLIADIVSLGAQDPSSLEKRQFTDDQGIWEVSPGRSRFRSFVTMIPSVKGL